MCLPPTHPFPSTQLTGEVKLLQQQLEASQHKLEDAQAAAAEAQRVHEEVAAAAERDAEQVVVLQRTMGHTEGRMEAIMQERDKLQDKVSVCFGGGIVWVWVCCGCMGVLWVYGCVVGEGVLCVGESVWNKHTKHISIHIPYTSTPAYPPSPHSKKKKNRLDSFVQKTNVSMKPSQKQHPSENA